MVQLNSESLISQMKTLDEKEVQLKKKKVSKTPISILISVSQKPFYVYQVKHDFLQIHNGRAKFWPSALALVLLSLISTSRLASKATPPAASSGEPMKSD